MKQSSAPIDGNVGVKRGAKKGKKSRKHRRNYRWDGVEHSTTKYRARHGYSKN